MKQGEIGLINLDPTIGAEIKKTRPAIVMNDDTLGKLPLKIIIPLTDWKDRYDLAPWMVKINPDAKYGLDKESAADCFQVRFLSQERFVRRLGFVSNHIMEDVKLGLSKVLSIDIK